MSSRDFNNWTDGNGFPVVQTGNAGSFNFWSEGNAFPILSVDGGTVLSISMSVPVEFKAGIRRSVTIPYEWKIQFFGLGIPVEWKQSLSPTKKIPVEWDDRPFLKTMPVEWLQSLKLGDTIPMEWGGVTLVTSARKNLIPVEWGGANSLDLLMIWNDRTPFETPLMHTWRDITLNAFVSDLTHTWDDIEPLDALTMDWNDIPDVLTPFGIDPITQDPLPGVCVGSVQMPSAVTDKTP